DADNSHSFMVGPSLPFGERGDAPAFPWERLQEDGALVLAAFGGKWSPPAAALEAIAQALRADEGQLVLALKERISEPFVQKLPEHVIAVEYAPQLALLARARAMITHGGANSVGECLAAGRPMLVVPLLHDQPLSALLVERAGAGRTLLL